MTSDFEKKDNNEKIQSYIDNLTINPNILNQYAGQSNYIKSTCLSGLYQNCKKHWKHYVFQCFFVVVIKRELDVKKHRTLFVIFVF